MLLRSALLMSVPCMFVWVTAGRVWLHLAIGLVPRRRSVIRTVVSSRTMPYWSGTAKPQLFARVRLTLTSHRSIRSQNPNTEGESILYAPCSPFTAGGRKGGVERVGSLVSSLAIPASSPTTIKLNAPRLTMVPAPPSLVAILLWAAIKHQRDEVERSRRDSL